MKSTRLIYWATTGLFSLMMAYSAYAYLVQPEMTQAFQHLGFPHYFRIELAIAKLLGVAVLLAPLPARLKEWAYAGFTLTLISATISHSAVGDPLPNRLMPMVMLAVLAASYFTYHKLRPAAAAE